MKATELRIGNIVFFHDKEMGKITYTHEEIIRGYEIQALEVDGYIRDIEVEPIPLTEEWLLKVGARKVNHIHGYVFWTLHNTKLNNATIDIYEHRTEFNNYGVKHCKYFHQLQNLYFAMTGEELIVSSNRD